MRIIKDSREESELEWDCENCHAVVAAKPSEGVTKFNSPQFEDWSLGGIEFTCPVCLKTTWVSESKVAKHRDPRKTPKPQQYKRLED